MHTAKGSRLPRNKKSRVNMVNKHKCMVYKYQYVHTSDWIKHTNGNWQIHKGESRQNSSKRQFMHIYIVEQEMGICVHDVKVQIYSNGIATAHIRFKDRNNVLF